MTEAAKKLSYFIPEWDDLVDPDYDYLADRHSRGGGDWATDVYAHQIYDIPNYDGVLVSRVVAEKSKRKAERINRMGVHAYLRLPAGMPVFGDCGAFGYIKDDAPPFTTEDILDYYTRLGFDMGVSVDHVIVPAVREDARRRYDLTVENAAEFIRGARAAGVPWTPVGALQGYDLASYAGAASACRKMGYDYVAVGGIARATTEDVLGIASVVREAVGPSVRIHLFGVARPAGIRAMASLGVTSVDSAGPLRSAWLGAKRNYHAADGRPYAAIRVPQAGKSFRAKRMTAEAGDIVAMEAEALRSVRELAAGRCSVGACLDSVLAYDSLMGEDRAELPALYRRTLEDRPWEKCPCAVCRECGVEVLIFRGNNRNRRRGFHNTFVFYQTLSRILAGEDVPAPPDESPGQPDLFSGVADD